MPERPMPPRPGARDVLKDGTDVTRWTDRALLIRAVDATLDLAGQIGEIATELSKLTGKYRELFGRHVALEERVQAVEERVAMPRPKMPSLQELVEEVREEIHDDIKEAVEEATNPGTEPRSNSDRVERALQRRDLEAKAKKWDDHEDSIRDAAKERRKIIYGAVGTLLGVILIAVALFVWQGMRLAAEKAIAHDVGVNEGKALSPVIAVPVSATSPTYIEPPFIIPTPSASTPKRHP